MQGRRASFNSIPWDARYLRGYLSLSLYLNSIHSATTLLRLSLGHRCGECAAVCAKRVRACLLSLFSQAYTRLFSFSSLRWDALLANRRVHPASVAAGAVSSKVGQRWARVQALTRTHPRRVHLPRGEAILQAAAVHPPLHLAHAGNLEPCAFGGVVKPPPLQHRMPQERILPVKERYTAAS